MKDTKEVIYRGVFEDFVDYEPRGIELIASKTGTSYMFELKGYKRPITRWDLNRHKVYVSTETLGFDDIYSTFRDLFLFFGRTDPLFNTSHHCNLMLLASCLEYLMTVSKMQREDEFKRALDRYISQAESIAEDWESKYINDGYIRGKRKLKEILRTLEQREEERKAKEEKQ